MDYRLAYGALAITLVLLIAGAAYMSSQAGGETRPSDIMQAS